MKNKAQVWIGVVLTLLILGACQSASLEKKDVWVADVRSAMEQNTPFSMKDDVMGIEYIPLETTDSCLISNLTYLIMDDDFIFVQNGKTDQVFKLYLEPSKQLQTMKNTWRQTFVYQLLLDFNTSNLLFGGSQKSAYLCNAFLPRRILRAFILPSRGQS